MRTLVKELSIRPLRFYFPVLSFFSQTFPMNSKALPTALGAIDTSLCRSSCSKRITHKISVKFQTLGAFQNRLSLLFGELSMHPSRVIQNNAEIFLLADSEA